MIKHQFTIACEKVIRNADDNSMSAITLFEDIESEVYPLLIPRVQFFTLIERDISADPAVIDCEVTLSLDGDALVMGRLPVEFMDKRRNRQVTQFVPLIIPHPGVLRYELKHDGELLGFYEMTFRLSASASDGSAQIQLPAPTATGDNEDA